MRRVQEIRENYSGEELLFAAKMNLTREGQTHTAKILDYLMRNPNESERIAKMCKNESSQEKMFSKETALSLITALNLSKCEYDILRNFLIHNGTNQFPSYYQIQKAKLDCYAAKQYIVIDEREAEINLQAILDHTVSRILATLPEENTDDQNLTLISKWGCDGSSNQSIL